MARDFDGIDDNVSVGSPAVLDDIFSVAGSICLWFNPDVEDGSNGRIINKRGASGAIFNIQSINTLRLFDDNYPTQNLIRVSSNNALTLDVWQHIAITWDGSGTAANVHIYVNGTETGYQTTQNGIGTRSTDAAENFTVGSTAAGGAPVNAGIADLRVYSVELTAAEIGNVMRGSLPRHDKVKLWLPLFGTSSPEPDWSGNGNNGTLTGTTRVDHPPAYSALWTRMIRRVQRVFAAGGTPHTKTVTDELVLAEAVVKGAGKVIVEVAALAEAAARGAGKVIADSVTVVDTLARGAGKVVEDALVLAEATSRAVVRSLAEAVTLVDTALKATVRTIADALAVVDPAATIQKVTLKVIEDTVSIAEATSRSIVRTLIVFSISIRDFQAGPIQTLFKTLVRTIGESVGVVDPAVTVQKIVQKVIDDTIALADSTARSVMRVLSDPVGVVDSALKSIVRLLTDVIAAIVDAVQSILTPGGAFVDIPFYQQRDIQALLAGTGGQAVTINGTVTKALVNVRSDRMLRGVGRSSLIAGVLELFIEKNKVPGLAVGATAVVDGVPRKVRYARDIGDGAMVHLYLAVD